jgi:NADH dehydrogenase FAD-containing subunit
MNELIENPGARSRIVIAGAGYAGYHCARRLERLLPREAAEIVIVSPTDYMPYASLLPQVGADTVDPRHIAVSLSATPSALTSRLAPSLWKAPTGNDANLAGTGWC